MDTIAVTGRFDLTDAQWAVLEPLLPTAKRPGRPSLWSKRQLIDGMRWRVRVGAPWRDVPVEYGSWSAVYEQADLQRASLAAAANRPLTRHRRRSSSPGLSLPGDLVWAAAPAAQPPPPDPIDAGQPPVAAGAPGAGVPARCGAAIQQPTPVRHSSNLGILWVGVMVAHVFPGGHAG